MSVDTFTLDVERKAGYAILRTDGYVNNLGGEKIAEQANQLIDEGFRYLVLNLEKSQVVNSIGISILIILVIRARAGAYTEGHMTTIENFGLYWHFVDIVWIALFAVIYLLK